MDELLKPYPVVIPVTVAWGEMDAFGHVNNIIYFRYFESARIAYFERLGYTDMMAETGVGPILASTRCRYRLPLTFPDTVSVGARVTDIETDRFTMAYIVVSHRHQKAAADGAGVVVSFNYRENAKSPLPESLIRQIESLEESRR